MVLRVVMLLALAVSVAAALPAVSFTVGSTTAQRGATIVIPVSIQATGAEQPAGMQYDLTFDPNILSYVSYGDGPSTTAAAKQGATSTPSTGVVRVVIFGLNANVMANGTISNVTFTVSQTAALGPATLGITGIQVSDPNAQTIPNNTGNAGTIDVVSGPPTYIGAVNDILTSANATIGVDFELIADATVDVAGVNFTVNYNPAVLTYTTSTAGSVVTAAGKGVTANMTSPGIVTVVIFGLNQNAIANGVLVSVGFTVNASAAGGAQTDVSLSNIAASKPDASAVGNIVTDSSIVTVPRVSLAPPATTMQARLNQNFVLPLSLNYHGSSAAAAGFQTDVEFDDSVFTYVSAAAGASATAAGKQVTAAILQGTTNVVRVVVFGLSASTMASGVAVNLTFTVNASAPLGNTRIYLDEFLATDANAIEIPFSATMDALATVTAFEPEDVNQDGNINVVDVQTTVNVILTINTPAYPGQGDVNNDTTVNVVDVQVIVNKILNPTP